MNSIKNALEAIIENSKQHALWLNTLSYLENCGARLIARCEHPTMVRETMLKHAAEEFHHAYYLKSQIAKVYPMPLESYQPQLLLGGYNALHFMTRLNIAISRMLIGEGYTGEALRGAAYALVSYCIELRAAEVYPTYQELLQRAKSRVSVRRIIVEEAHHLEEMKREVHELDNHQKLSLQAQAIEQELYSHIVGELTPHQCV